jgi:hypothetical protein
MEAGESSEHPYYTKSNHEWHTPSSLGSHIQVCRVMEGSTPIGVSLGERKSGARKKQTWSHTMNKTKYPTLKKPKMHSNESNEWSYFSTCHSINDTL